MIYCLEIKVALSHVFLDIDYLKNLLNLIFCCCVFELPFVGDGGNHINIVFAVDTSSSTSYVKSSAILNLKLVKG